MSEWQPIESAPKDGTRIIAYLNDGEVDDDFYGDGEIYVIAWGDHYEHGAGWLIDREEQFAAWCNPTHWQPLSEPPNA